MIWEIRYNDYVTDRVKLYSKKTNFEFSNS